MDKKRKASDDQLEEVHSETFPKVQQKAALFLSSDVKNIHFVRHAEGTHNRAKALHGRPALDDWEHVDARLTDTGVQQAVDARPAADELDVDIVVVSPLSRTIQTATHLFGHKNEQFKATLNSTRDRQNIPFVAIEPLRERIGQHPCDKRRTVTELSKEFPHVSFEHIVEDDPHWSEAREPWLDLIARSNEVIDFLLSLPQKNIAVVTHNDWLQGLFNHSGFTYFEGERTGFFKNCEIKTLMLGPMRRPEAPIPIPKTKAP